MYEVIWEDDVYSEVATTWLNAVDRIAVIDAIHEIDKVLMRDPTNSGTELSEGLRWIDIAPVRAIYSVDEPTKSVNAHRIRQV